MGLEDRVALVTGGGRGIGRAIAELFHREGARVAVASRNMEDLRNFAARIDAGDHRIVPVRCDVTDGGDVEAMVGKVAELWGRIDVVVNNAGLSGATPIAPGDEPGARERIDSLWRQILETNLTGMFRVTREAVSRMPDGGGGRILNISSVLGKFGVAGRAAYCASKTGVIGFTRALALELAPRRITVNALCPGWVETDMARQGVEDAARRQGVTPEEFRRQAEGRVPLGRFLDPVEVARAALFLASDAGACITGQAINVDGGAAMW